MNKEEILAEIQALENQNQEFNQLVKNLDKKVTKNLRWWWLVPFFGFIIYQMIVQKRKQTEQYQSDSVTIKTELFKNEFQILKLKKQLSDLEKNNF